MGSEFRLLLLRCETEISERCLPVHSCLSLVVMYFRGQAPAGGTDLKGPTRCHCSMQLGRGPFLTCDISSTLILTRHIPSQTCNSVSFPAQRCASHCIARDGVGTHVSRQRGAGSARAARERRKRAQARRAFAFRAGAGGAPSPSPSFSVSRHLTDTPTVCPVVSEPALHQLACLAQVPFESRLHRVPRLSPVLDAPTLPKVPDVPHGDAQDARAPAAGEISQRYH